MLFPHHHLQKRPRFTLVLLIAAMIAASAAYAWESRSQSLANTAPARASVSRLAGPVKRSSSVIAITPDGNTLLVVNPDSSSLSLVSLGTLMTVTEVPVGADPRAVAVDDAGRWAYVANHGAASVSVLDLTAQSVVAEISVGYRPAGVAVSPDGRFIAVAELGDDSVRFLDKVTLDTLSVVAVADRPHGLAFTPDGQRLLVTHLLSGNVTIVPVLPFISFLPIVQKGGDWQDGGFVTPFYRQPPNLPANQIATLPNVAPAPAVIINASGTRAYLPQTMAHGQGLNTQFDITVFPKVSVINLEAGKY